MYPELELDAARSKWISTCAEFTARLAKEHRAELDDAVKAARFPREIYRELGLSGYLGTFVPLEFGGMGRGVAEYVIVSEEVGRHGLVSGQIAAQGQRWLLDWGTAEQREQWLRGITTGELIFSEAISEPGAGSSFATLRAQAERDGSDWILTGEKTHVNMGADCDVTIFYALAGEGLTSFLVDMSLPGIRATQTDPIGLRLIPTADISFDHVRVPSSALLGEPGGGLQTFLSTFNVSRLGNASELIGLARRALAEGISYARERQVGTNLVTDFQGIQWMIADAWISVRAAALARDHAALAYERDPDIGLETSTAKCLAISAAEQAVNAAFSMVGGYGLYGERPFVDIQNDVRVLKVAGGSMEILRNYVARRVLKDPGHQGIA